MSDTRELSSPLPLLTPAHACTDLHSKLVHLNTGETILRLALWNSPESVYMCVCALCVCVRCLFEYQSLIPLPFLPLNSVSFCISGAYSTCGYQADSVCSLQICVWALCAVWFGFLHLMQKKIALWVNADVSTSCISKSWRQMRDLMWGNVFMVQKNPELLNILWRKSKQWSKLGTSVDRVPS